MLMLGLLVSSHALAQMNPNRNIADNQVFFAKMNIIDYPIKERKTLYWYVDFVYRSQSAWNNKNLFGEPLRLSVRPWIGWQFSRYTKMAFTPLGFHSMDQIQVFEGDAAVPRSWEWRTTLELLTDQYWIHKKKEWINFTHRFRAEYRRLDFPGKLGDPYNAIRLRYRIRARIPLNRKHFYDNKVFYGVLFSEIHVQIGERIESNLFSQSRNFVGLGYRFWDMARIELGYVHVYHTRRQWEDMSLGKGIHLYVFIDYLSKLRFTKSEPDPLNF